MMVDVENDGGHGHISERIHFLCVIMEHNCIKSVWRDQGLSLVALFHGANVSLFHPTNYKMAITLIRT